MLCLHVPSQVIGSGTKQVDPWLLRSGFEFDIVVNNGFVNTYATCANVYIAHKFFERMPGQNVVS